MRANDFFAKLCRQNTGSHICDSGMAYGYHYEKPLPKIPVSLSVYKNEISATISTPHFLSDAYRYLRSETQKFIRFAKTQDHGWLGCLDAYAEKLGLKIETINTYNEDNDLDQTLQISFLYSNDISDPELIFIQSHNGCDVRGGYTQPVCVEPIGDIVWSFVASFYISDGVDQNGEPLTDDQKLALGEEWYSGYHSWPTGKLNADIERVIEHDQTSAKIKLKTGETVIVHPTLY